MRGSCSPKPEVELTVFQSAHKKGCQAEQRDGTGRTVSSLVLRGRNKAEEQVYLWHCSSDLSTQGFESVQFSC